MEEIIGPNLPPRFREQDRDTDKNLIGPTPTDGPAGPMLPPPVPEEVKTKAVESSKYGPQLPPDIITAPRTSSYGPALPPGFQRQPSPEGPVVEDAGYHITSSIMNLIG